MSGTVITTVALNDICTRVMGPFGSLTLASLPTFIETVIPIMQHDYPVLAGSDTKTLIMSIINVAVARSSLDSQTVQLIHEAAPYFIDATMKIPVGFLGRLIMNDINKLQSIVTDKSFWEKYFGWCRCCCKSKVP